MFSVDLSTRADLSTREPDGPVVVALRGELDVMDAASVVAQLSGVATRGRVVIVDLAGLDFIDSSGIAALVRVRRNARHAGGDLLLAAPQRQVLRVLAVTRLIDAFSVHDGVAEAAVTTVRLPGGRSSHPDTSDMTGGVDQPTSIASRARPGTLHKHWFRPVHRTGRGGW